MSTFTHTQVCYGCGEEVTLITDLTHALVQAEQSFVDDWTDEVVVTKESTYEVECPNTNIASYGFPCGTPLVFDMEDWMETEDVPGLDQHAKVQVAA